MLATAGQRSSGIILVPLCAPDNVRVIIHRRNIALTAMEDVTPAQRRNSNMLSDGFAGIIVAVGSDIVGREFKIGVAVAGVASGGWVNILDGSNQEYLDLKPENLWPISTATARKFGLYSTSSHGPYAIG